MLILGLPRDHPESYHYFMWNNFFKHIDIQPANVHILDGNAADLDAECESYEKKITEAGGIHLFIGGLYVILDFLFLFLVLYHMCFTCQVSGRMAISLSTNQVLLWYQEPELKRLPKKRWKPMPDSSIMIYPKYLNEH